MKKFPRFVMGLGRICMSLLFLLSGASALFHWQQMEASVSGTLTDWHSHMMNSEMFGQLFSNLLAWTSFLLTVAVVFQLLGGILLFFGWKVRLGCVLLLLFLLPSMILFHPFWYAEGPEKANQVAIFFKNLSIVGGLLCLLVIGGTKKPAKVPSSAPHPGPKPG